MTIGNGDPPRRPVDPYGPVPLSRRLAGSLDRLRRAVDGRGRHRAPDVAAPDHQRIEWWHSIDLGDGVVTRGKKPVSELETDFSRLGLTQAEIAGRSVLDVGCSDGFMSLKFEALGAEVTAVDGIYRDGLRYVRRHLRPKFRFYAMDVLSHSFNELGRFDVVLYLGVLYHTVYPFEHLVRLANRVREGGLLVIESGFYNLPGFEKEATLFFNFDGRLTPDLSSPAFPSIRWIEQALGRVGFDEIVVLHTTGGNGPGRVTVRARYGGTANAPTLFAAEQVEV